MKPIKLLPKKSKKGWRLNIPPILSETCKRRRLFFRSRENAERIAIPLRKTLRIGEVQRIPPFTKSRFAIRAYELLGREHQKNSFNRTD